MGGDLTTLRPAEAKSALAWWLEAGVDCALTEEPRNWLEPAPSAAKAGEPAVPVARNVGRKRDAFWCKAALNFKPDRTRTPAIVRQGIRGKLDCVRPLHDSIGWNVQVVNLPFSTELTPCKEGGNRYGLAV